MYASQIAKKCLSCLHVLCECMHVRVSVFVCFYDDNFHFSSDPTSNSYVATVQHNYILSLPTLALLLHK